MIFINSSPRNSLKIFQPFLPVFVPVGIGYLMTVLKANGIESVCFDEQVENNILKKIEKKTKEFPRPLIFGFSVLTAALKNALQLSEKLKMLYPDSIIIFGGIHPTACPDEVLNYWQVDYVVRGEAENIISELYHGIRNQKDISQIESLSYRKNKINVHNPRSEGITDLNVLPKFPYHIFENKKYDLGFVMSSRGCPYNCLFCSNKINSQRRFRYRDPDSVVEDLTLLHQKHKRKYVYFLDDNLLADNDRIIKLAQKIKSSPIAGKMIYNFQARGDNSNHEVLKELFEAGFRGVYFGIETASESLMKTVNKGETVARVIEAIKTAKEIGYHVSGNYIFSLPGETHKDRMDAISLTKKINLDLVKYNNATPYPGTELYNIAREQNRLHIIGNYENINSVSTFIENPFKKIPFSYIPEGNTEKEIRRDILAGYFSFYFNIKHLKGVFTRPDLNNAWFDFGHSFFDFIKKLPALLVLSTLLTVKFGSFLFSCPFSKKSALQK